MNGAELNERRSATLRKLGAIFALFVLVLVAAATICSAVGVSNAVGTSIAYAGLLLAAFLTSFDTRDGGAVNLASVIAQRPIAFTARKRQLIRLSEINANRRRSVILAVALLVLMALMIAAVALVLPDDLQVPVSLGVLALMSMLTLTVIVRASKA